jgi:hypothetical protein
MTEQPRFSTALMDVLVMFSKVFGGFAAYAASLYLAWRINPVYGIGVACGLYVIVIVFVFAWWKFKWDRERFERDQK